MDAGLAQRSEIGSTDFLVSACPLAAPADPVAAPSFTGFWKRFCVALLCAFGVGSPVAAQPAEDAGPMPTHFVDADASVRVVYAGSSGPTQELIRAELALLGAELVLLPRALIGQNDANILEHTGAQAVIRNPSDGTSQISLRRCGGVQLARTAPGEDDGAAALLVTETLWAQLRQPCPEVLRLPEVRRPPETAAAGLSIPARIPQRWNRWAVEADVAFAQSFGGLDAHAVANLGLRFRPLRWLRTGVDLSTPIGSPTLGAGSVRSRAFQGAFLIGSALSLGSASLMLEVGPGLQWASFTAEAGQRGAVAEQSRWIPSARSSLALHVPLNDRLFLRLLTRVDVPFRTVHVWLNREHLGTYGTQVHLGAGVAATF